MIWKTFRLSGVLLCGIFLLTGHAWAEASLWSVGSNYSGQLGDGTIIDRYSPVAVLGTGANGVLAVSAGAVHTMFLKDDGSLWAMGNNGFGQLGDGTIISRSIPVAVQGAGTSGVIAVAAGSFHTMFLKQDGSLWAMGENVRGLLGDGTTITRSTPVAVIGAGASGVIAVAAGGDHTVFLKQDGSLWAMGQNKWGQLGNGQSTEDPNSTPVAVEGAGAGGVKAVSAGWEHTVFLKEDGSLWGMGANQYGQLGDGTIIDRFTPVAATGAGSSGVLTLAAGQAHTVFLKQDGSLWAMGLNEYGQLGAGQSITDYASDPVAVRGAGSNAVKAVAAGWEHTVFLKEDGSLWTMGRNSFGQLGNRSLNSRFIPVAVKGAGAEGVQALAVGVGHTVFITSGSILNITPLQTGLRRNLVVTGQGFGTLPLRARLVEAFPAERKKPRTVRMVVQRDTQSDSQVTLQALTGKAGQYRLELQPRGQKVPLVSGQFVDLMPPAPDAVEGSVARNGQLVITGAFFGMAKGMVILRQAGVTKPRKTRLKLAKADGWNDTRLVGTIAHNQLPGIYTVSVKTRLGETIADGELTITE
jgi:ribosomal protein L27